MDDSLRIAMDAGLPYTGLRDFELDPKLLRYVPLTYANRERIVPMLIVGDTLKLAATVPDPDIGPLRAAFPQLEIDVVIASAEEIDGVLRRAERVA